MPSELTNLLPPEKRTAFRREYFLRLATVAVWLVTGVFLLQIVLLLPSYLYERHAVSTRTEALTRLATSNATIQQQEVQQTLQVLQAESRALTSLAAKPTASTALRAVLAVPRPGITLSGFVYGQSATASNRTLQVRGIATTREALRSYDAALGALPFVSSADLPVSEYAQDSQIPFTITLTGTLAP